MAEVYENIGDYAQKVETLRKAMDIAQAVYGEKSIKMANLISNLSTAYLKMKDYDHALDNIKRAKEIKRIYYGENSYEVALESIMEGMVYEGKKDYLKAIESYSMYLNVARPIKGDNSREIIAHVGIIYSLFYSLLAEEPSQKNIEWFKRFMEDKIFVMIPVDGGVAAKKGLKGEMQILQYFNWNIQDSSACFYDVHAKNRSQPKSFVVMNQDGNIESHQFEESTIGVQFLCKFIDSEKKKEIIKSWQQWNAKSI